MQRPASRLQLCYLFPKPICHIGFIISSIAHTLAPASIALHSVDRVAAQEPGYFLMWGFNSSFNRMCKSLIW